LELTMIHEGLVLDVSGHHLALLEWAGAVRQLVLLTLVANLFLPWGIARTLEPAALGLALLAWLAKLLVFAVAVAFTESLTAKMRLFRVPEFLGMAFLLALAFLLSALYAAAQRRLLAAVTAYRWNSIVLGLIAATVALATGARHIALAAVLVFAGKAIAIPALLRRQAALGRGDTTDEPFM